MSIDERLNTNNKYLIIYTDGDSEEMSHREFLKHNKNVVGQVAELNKSNQDKNIQWVKLSCNCVAASCIHPWVIIYVGFININDIIMKIKTEVKTEAAPCFLAML